MIGVRLSPESLGLLAFERTSSLTCRAKPCRFEEAFDRDNGTRAERMTRVKSSTAITRKEFGNDGRS